MTACAECVCGATEGRRAFDRWSSVATYKSITAVYALLLHLTDLVLRGRTIHDDAGHVGCRR